MSSAELRHSICLKFPNELPTRSSDFAAKAGRGLLQIHSHYGANLYPLPGSAGAGDEGRLVSCVRGRVD